VVAGFPVPRPSDASRHCVVMELAHGYQLNSIQTLRHPGMVFDALMELICKLASCVA
jgi:RIO kinase 2